MKIDFGFKCETLLTSRDIVKTDGPFDVLLAQRELVSRFMRDCNILREILARWSFRSTLQNQSCKLKEIALNNNCWFFYRDREHINTF